MESPKLTILGSNSALPAYDRHPTAQILSVHQDLFLIDCGEGCQMQLSRYHVRRSKISHIFISHLHGDHIYGLPGLISSYNHYGRHKSLQIYGPPGLKIFIETTLLVTENSFDFDLHIHEFDPEVPHQIIKNDWLEVKTIPLFHRIPTAGYLFHIKNPLKKIKPGIFEKYQVENTLRGAIQRGADYKRADGKIIPNSEFVLSDESSRSYAYLSDTRYEPSLVDQLKGVHTLYHEATFLSHLQNKAQTTMHSTAREAALIAKGAMAEKLLIGHFSSRYENLTPFLTEARQEFESTHLALEGRIFDI